MTTVRITWIEGGTLAYRDVPGRSVTEVCHDLRSYFPYGADIIKIELVPVSG